VVTLAAFGLAGVALAMDRRRGISGLGFVPWDLVLIASVLVALLAGTMWLKGVLAG
jgi:hypothetical protein